MIDLTLLSITIQRLKENVHILFDPVIIEVRNTEINNLENIKKLLEKLPENYLHFENLSTIEIDNLPVKIFVLEDDERRIKYLQKHIKEIVKTPKKIQLTFAREIEEAKLMFKPPYDLIFLDHDLGNRQMVDSDDPNTGYQFAKYLKEIGIDTAVTGVYTHSLNPLGRQNIKAVLPGTRDLSIFNF